MDELVESLQRNYGLGTTSSYIISVIGIVLIYAVLLAVCYFFWKLIQKVNHRIFQKLEEKKGRSVTLEFMEKLVSFGITFFFLIIVPFNWDDIGNSVFGSAAVLTAVIGFAGQDVIKDILAGIQISIYKPFDIGDRIETSDGSAGVIEKISMRHIVIKRIDTIRIVIPNSKMNELTVLNYSYEDVPRSVMLRFPVSYKSDIEKAKQVIGDVIRDSELTIPGMHTEDGSLDYAPVYFIELAESALIMSVTVYFDKGIRTERVRDAINTSVFEALAANGIEIPYNYMNVVLHNQ